MVLNKPQLRCGPYQVPQFKPEAALELMGSWIKNEPWKAYNGSCSAPSAQAPTPQSIDVELARVRAEMKLLEAKEQELMRKKSD